MKKNHNIIQAPENLNVYTEVKKKWGFLKHNTARVEIPGTTQMMNDTKGREVLASLKHVDITYGSGSKAFRAVTDMNLNIYKGEVLGLVGESGSGKSTTGKALVGLNNYSFGEIKLLDKVLPKKLSRGFKYGKSLKEYKEIEQFVINKVQMIFQDPANSLNPHVNVKAVVSEGLYNTKNAKEIYLYNQDQRVFAEIYKSLHKFNPDVYNKDFFDKTNVQLNIDSITAFKVLYEDLFEKVSKEISDSQVLEYFRNEKNKREIESNWSEAQCRDILVIDILKSVGLDESVLKRFPLEFSGGQQQRIGISRSVILRPELLVADEPISALDVSIQAQVVNIFNDLKDKYNLTILFIAHDLRMVEYISDRIAVMNKGVLLEVGKTEEIVKNPIHPYTRSLLDAVPSIESIKTSLIKSLYDPSIHNYSDEVQPEWIKVADEHYVLGTKEEVQEWINTSK
ncbi:ABC transporter ATP-binding protein [Mycoplasmopsis ciconiae]|uniref:ABC transporter ATP-binding protein n=1 Tax=Mycoplasmopsis ciconiae TaxID=561067 RepID=A0ABU7MM18_9BACT|nr:ABC transporter ATP-binding protein [Mycoplasmopsis ciconiae]